MPGETLISRPERSGLAYWGGVDQSEILTFLLGIMFCGVVAFLCD